MLREVRDFYDLAKSFLNPSAEDCLESFRSRLEIIRSKAALANNPPEVVNKQYSWIIPDNQPLLTKASRRYERGKRRGGLDVVGRLTAVWEIVPDAKRNKFDNPKQFRLAGNASVVVQWVNLADHTTISQWNVDVAGPPLVPVRLLLRGVCSTPNSTTPAEYQCPGSLASRSPRLPWPNLYSGNCFRTTGSATVWGPRARTGLRPRSRGSCGCLSGSRRWSRAVLDRLGQR
jgi:hypothetical protein